MSRKPFPTFLSGAAAIASLALPSTAQVFVDVTPMSGVLNVPLSNSGDGSGLCCADFDGDGDLDLVIPGAPGTPILYFENYGGMTFSNKTAVAGLGVAPMPRGVLAADVDNDGDQDLLVANWRAPLQLFINAGNATFTEEAAQRGLVTITSVHSASFGDFDRDGWLDLYLSNREDPVTNLGQANTLYRGIGNGQFVDVSAGSGADHLGLTYAAPFFDYDEDGWPDIILANDKGVLGVPNALLRNNGNGTFTDVGPQVNAAQVMDGMGCDYADVFNDGGMDAFLSDDPPDHLFLRWNPATGQFVDDTYTYGLMGTGIGWAVNFFDYDNDAWQDLYIVQNGTPNGLMHNPGVPAAPAVVWTDTAFPLGLGIFYSQYTAIVADLDDDGGIDVVNRYHVHPVVPPPSGVTVHRNNVPRGHWLRFRTHGVVSNRDGIGARIEVETGTLRQRLYRRSGTGYLSGSDPRVHFGLGAATQADRVTITWPSGQVQFLDNVPANQTLDVIEPSFLMTGPATAGGTTTLELDVQGDAGLLFGMVLSFTNQPRTLLPDGRSLPLTLDALSSYSLVPGNVFLSNPLGFLDAQGHATSQLSIPNQPAFVGLTIWATAATVEPQGYPAVRTIFPEPIEILIQ